MNSRRMHFLLVSVFFALGGLGSNSNAEVAVVIELIPDNPGPYAGGEVLTVDVWLHSQVAFDAFPHTVQLDFSDSDPELVLDPTFTFDLSAIPVDRGDYTTFPELLVPVVGVAHTGSISPENMLPLPAGGSLHIGSLGLQLPTDLGIYLLDALNSDAPDEVLGARIDTRLFPGGDFWRAFTGEITGGTVAFVVSDIRVPTVSVWGLIVMTLLVLVAGSVTIMRHRRSITRNMLVVALLVLWLGQASTLAQSPDGGVALNVRQTNGSFELTLDNAAPFHVTERQVANPQLIDMHP